MQRIFTLAGGHRLTVAVLLTMLAPAPADARQCDLTEPVILSCTFVGATEGRSSIEPVDATITLSIGTFSKLGGGCGAAEQGLPTFCAVNACNLSENQIACVTTEGRDGTTIEIDRFTGRAALHCWSKGSGVDVTVEARGECVPATKRPKLF